jgi:hypothetical protein
MILQFNSGELEEKSGQAERKVDLRPINLIWIMPT